MTAGFVYDNYRYIEDEIYGKGIAVTFYLKIESNNAANIKNLDSFINYVNGLRIKDFFEHSDIKIERWFGKEANLLKRRLSYASPVEVKEKRDKIDLLLFKPKVEGITPVISHNMLTRFSYEEEDKKLPIKIEDIVNSARKKRLLKIGFDNENLDWYK